MSILITKRRPALPWTMPLLLLCAPLAAQDAGVPTEWDIRKTLSQFTAQTGRLTPVLEQVKPETWADASAASAYAGQAKSLRAEIGYLARTVEILREDPEKMSVTLEAFLRLQSIDAMLQSLAEGVRRHQNPALADLMLGVSAENEATRVHLREYLVELVLSKEQELKVMDQEAQRCRSSLIRAPKPAKKEASR